MTGLRFVKRKVQPFDAGFPVYQHILQFHAGQHGWLDVPIVVEDESTNNRTEKAE